MEELKLIPAQPGYYDLCITRDWSIILDPIIGWESYTGPDAHKKVRALTADGVRQGSAILMPDGRVRRRDGDGCLVFFPSIGNYLLDMQRREGIELP